MAGGTTIVDRLNKLSGKDATTIVKVLENVEEAGIGGGGGSGYSIVTKKVAFFNQQVTPDPEYSSKYGVIPLDIMSFDIPEEAPEILYVTYDGTEYICNRFIDDEGRSCYGAPYIQYTSDLDFSDYPFRVQVDGYEYPHIGAYIDVNDRDTHTIVLSAFKTQGSITDEFANAAMLAVTGRLSSTPAYKVDRLEQIFDGVIPFHWVDEYTGEETWEVFDTPIRIWNYAYDNALMISSFNDEEPKFGKWEWVETEDSSESYKLSISDNIFIVLKHREDESGYDNYLEDANGTIIDLPTFGEHQLRLSTYHTYTHSEDITVSENLSEVVNSLLPEHPIKYIDVQRNNSSVWTNTKYEEIDYYVRYSWGKNYYVYVYDTTWGVTADRAEKLSNGYRFTGIHIDDSNNVSIVRYTFTTDNKVTVEEIPLQTRA